MRTGGSFGGEEFPRVAPGPVPRGFRRWHPPPRRSRPPSAGPVLSRPRGEEQHEAATTREIRAAAPKAHCTPPTKAALGAAPRVEQRVGARGQHGDRDGGADRGGDLLGGAEERRAVGVEVRRQRAEAEGEDRREQRGQAHHQQHVRAQHQGVRRGLADPAQHGEPRDDADRCPGSRAVAHRPGRRRGPRGGRAGPWRCRRGRPAGRSGAGSVRAAPAGRGAAGSSRPSSPGTTPTGR